MKMVTIMIKPADLIAELSEMSPNKINDLMTELSMWGARVSASGDPVARYVLTQSRYHRGVIGPDWWCFTSLVDDRTGTYYHEHGLTPTTVAEFQRRFDASEYPHLISSVYESPDRIGARNDSGSYSPIG